MAHPSKICDTYRVHLITAFALVYPVAAAIWQQFLPFLTVPIAPHLPSFGRNLLAYIALALVAFTLRNLPVIVVLCFLPLKRWSRVGIIAAWIVFVPFELFLAQMVYQTYVFSTPPIASVTADNFRPENYGYPPGGGTSESLLSEALNKVFPTGTPNTLVDHILVEQNGSEKQDVTVHGTSETVYSHTGPMEFVQFSCISLHWTITVSYSAASTVTGISVSGPCNNIVNGRGF